MLIWFRSPVRSSLVGYRWQLHSLGLPNSEPLEFDFLGCCLLIRASRPSAGSRKRIRIPGGRGRNKREATGQDFPQQDSWEGGVQGHRLVHTTLDEVGHNEPAGPLGKRVNKHQETDCTACLWKFSLRNVLTAPPTTTFPTSLQIFSNGNLPFSLDLI